MPGHKVHRYVTRLFFGKSYSEVHKALDRAYVFAGRKHRRFFHEPLEAYVMGNVASLDGKGGHVALLHIWLDNECTENRDFKKFVELMARRDELWRKQMRQYKKMLKRQR
jgi:hypothetical protein